MPTARRLVLDDYYELAAVIEYDSGKYVNLLPLRLDLKHVPKPGFPDHRMAPQKNLHDALGSSVKSRVDRGAPLCRPLKQPGYNRVLVEFSGSVGEEIRPMLFQHEQASLVRLFDMEGVSSG